MPTLSQGSLTRTVFSAVREPLPELSHADAAASGAHNGYFYEAELLTGPTSASLFRGAMRRVASVPDRDSLDKAYRELNSP